MISILIVFFYAKVFHIRANGRHYAEKPGSNWARKAGLSIYMGASLFCVTKENG